jgi:hypothetical protein
MIFETTDLDINQALEMSGNPPITIDLLKRNKDSSVYNTIWNLAVTLAKLRVTTVALSELLEDTQHSNHDCKDEACPVKTARMVAQELKNDHS